MTKIKFSAAETMKQHPPKLRLSPSQIRVLQIATKHKLVRSSVGWSIDDDEIKSKHPFFFTPNTIKSLWNLGLLDANFDDPKGVGPSRESFKLQNEERRKLLVWTNRRGLEALKDTARLSDEISIALH